MIDYRKTLAVLREGRYRTTRDLRNGWGVIPAGTAVRITDKRGGLEIEAEECECCGVRMTMRGVGAGSLEEVHDGPA